MRSGWLVPCVLVGAQMAWGDAPRVVASGRFVDVAPAWSPDNARIAYVIRGKGGKRELWVVGSEGHGARKLLSGVGSGAAPRWSTRSNQIAIVAGQSERGVMVVCVDGGNAPRLVAPGARLPCWDARGERIACTDGTDVFVIDASGQPHALTHEREPSLFRGLAWSPDGSHIASDANGEIKVLRVQKGASWRALASHGSGAAAPFRSPEFSHDGKHVYFTIDREGVYDAAAGSNGVGRVDMRTRTVEVICDAESWSLARGTLAVSRGGEVVVHEAGRERKVARGGRPGLARDAGHVAYIVETDTNGDGRTDFRDRQQLVVKRLAGRATP